MSESAHPKFPRLFTPLKLRNVTLKNRVAVSAHFAGWWVDGGLPSDAFVAYVEERARGGVGLFVIGATSPQRGSGWLENVSDDIVPRYRALVDAAHRHGMAVFAQFCHPGFKPLPGTPIIEPPLSAPTTQPAETPAPPAPRTIDELHRLIEDFGHAARRAARGGVDGVELHSHESFLHAQMLNPLWNTRQDEYGGSLENRMRFMIETLEAMRGAVGKDMPLGVRLKLDDMAQRGMSQAEYVECVKKLEALDLVDYLNVTGGDGRFHHGPMPRPEGEWLPLVKTLRGGTKLTLMHAGRINTPEMAEKALAEGVLDVVCMTKTHICDPHFARKVFEDRLDDIRFCTRCMQACHGHMETMTCVYNPVTSREREWAELKLAEKKKRIIVIGAGPAGMEAALVASQRGHDVIVLEKSDRIGGQVLLGAASPLRKNWMRIAEFYDRQSRKGLFEVRLGTDAHVDLVLALKPDVVVVATGSRPNRLDIHGGARALTVHEVIGGKADATKNVVLFDREGFNRPLVVADYLSSRGIAVQFVTSLPQVCATVEGMMLEEMIAQLRGRGVSFAAGDDIVGWDKDRVLRLRSVQTAHERIIDNVDAVVATIGSTSVSDMQRSLKDRVPELHVVGDASSPQTVEAATYMGGHVGRLI